MKFNFANRMNNLKSSPLRENAKKNMELSDVISFAYGFPPEEAFPVEVMSSVSAEIYRKLSPEAFLQYGASEGDPELRELIKKRLIELVGIPQAKYEELLIVSGATQAIDLAVKILCNEGDIVLCEEQTFSGGVNAIRGYGATPVAIPMKIDEETVDLQALEHLLANDTRKKIKMIYLIPTFQNPLGTSIPLAQRQAIYELAKKYQVIIFEDDPYGDLLYQGKSIPKIKSLDDEGLVIYAGSFSKILAPSTRLGFVLASKPIFQKMCIAKQVTDSHCNQYWQVMLTEIMKHHDFEGHIAYLRELYSNKCSLMISELNKLDSEQLSFIEPKGGFFICCRMSDQIDEEFFYNYLNKHKVAVIPGDLMSVAGNGYGKYFRLNFTKPSDKDIIDGINIIGEAITYASEKELSQVS